VGYAVYRTRTSCYSADVNIAAPIADNDFLPRMVHIREHVAEHEGKRLVRCRRARQRAKLSEEARATARKVTEDPDACGALPATIICHHDRVSDEGCVDVPDR